MSALTSKRLFLGILALAIAGLGLTGCNRQAAPQPATLTASPSGTQKAPTAGDLYDIAEMDFKSGPTELTSERHSGPFSAGNALNIDAQDHRDCTRRKVQCLDLW
jgi:hypothetical protein